jgi:hypothetical protein
LLYIGSFVKPMYEAAVKNFSALAELVGRVAHILEIAGGSDILRFAAIALILVFLTARIVKKKRGRFPKTFLAGNIPPNHRASDRFFERKRATTLKPCPNCAEQLPLSALICDACDYNFLAARPGRGQQLLPPPHPLTHEASEQRIASARL